MNLTAAFEIVKRAFRDSQGAPAPNDIFSTGQFPLCPETHDLGIRRLFDLATLLLLLDCRPGDVVLDIGAGAGFSSEMLARLGYSVVALDPDCLALSQNRHRLRIDRTRIKGSITVAAGLAERLPVSDMVFDGVLGMNVLHHVDDLEGVLNELARVLKPGCRAVFVEPGIDHLTSDEAQRAIREHGENDRGFDVFEFLRMARTRGFEEAMVSATLQSALRLLPVQEVELYLSGTHPRPHLTDRGVIEELHRRHAYAMIVRDGHRRPTSRHPNILRHTLAIRGVPPTGGGGATFTITATVENSGDTVWLHAPSRFGGFVTFGCKLVTSEGRLVDDALGRTMLPRDVLPGESVTLEPTIKLPQQLSEGEYELRFDMVNELVCWFSDLGHPSSVFPLHVTS